MPSDPETIVRAFCGTWGGSDVDTIAGFLAPDVAWENVPIGIIHGRDAARERIAEVFAKAERIEWELLAIATTTDGAVLTERVDRLQLSGGTVDLRIMGLFRVGAEGITLWRDYFDAGLYARDLARCSG